MHRLLVLNGPNLNMLGLRQPGIYGSETLEDVERRCADHAASCNVTVDFRQSNHEGVLVEALHEARTDFDGVILNAGAYTHTSVALMDAISASETPVIELHISNVHAREAFRHKSFIAPVALGVICGFGTRGYTLAMDALISHLEPGA